MGRAQVKKKKSIFSCEHESFSSGFVHPDLAHSPPFMRHRCEKLKSLFSEQHVVAILDGFLTLGLVSALLYMHHGSVSYSPAQQSLALWKSGESVIRNIVPMASKVKEIVERSYNCT